jgi:hypothetical protein
VQDVAVGDSQVNVLLPPLTMVLGFAANEIVGGVPAGVTSIVTDCETV